MVVASAVVVVVYWLLGLVVVVRLYCGRRFLKASKITVLVSIYGTFYGDHSCFLLLHTYVDNPASGCIEGIEEFITFKQ